MDPEKYLKKNSHYHEDLINFYKFHIPEDSSVLEIGCGTGYLLNALKPSYGCGIDISEEAIKLAKQKYTHLEFININAESFIVDKKFDYIIISDTLGMIGNIQKVFQNISKMCSTETRIIINSHNFLWLPILQLAELLRLKNKSPKDNWLDLQDLMNLLEIENFEVIKKGHRFIFPIKLPIITNLINRYIGNLPFINSLGITNFIIARSINFSEVGTKELRTSVIVPVRNEKGNVENAVTRIPKLGNHTEIVFVEGNSDDDTYDEILRVKNKYKDMDIKAIKQDGHGKADAVRKGFKNANGDILIILDGDLTVMPEDLLSFYNALRTNKGEFIFGSRLVYPLEQDSMKTLNIIGNKFFSIVFSWLLDTRIKDTLCGTKAISKNNYLKLVKQRSYFGEFDPFGDFDLLLGAAKLDLKFTEIPVRYKKRSYGKTNISRFKNGLQLLNMVFFTLNKIKFV